MELDSALEQLGHWGKFQLISYGLLCVPIVFHAVFYLTYVFTAMDVEHRQGSDTCPLFSSRATH